MQIYFWTILTVLAVLPSVFTEECRSPGGFVSYCVPLEKCKPVYDFMRSINSRPMTLEERQFIGRLQCKHSFGEALAICCTTDDPNFISLFIENGTVISTEQRFTDGSILPKIENFECGIDFLANRIFGGGNSQLNEFPWMALLEYLKPNGLSSISCGGSLINRRYVLTAAHCLVGDILKFKGQLVNVRLGEYDLDTLIDCVSSDDGNTVCAPPVLNMPVESYNSHPGYTTLFTNDIGLIRLALYVPEVSHIYPICLPPSMFKSRQGTNYAVIGWGKTARARKSSVLQKLIVPLFSLKQCQRLYTQLSIDDTQICAGGKMGQDSCNGDSGGPLMTVFNSVWIIEGLVSVGLDICGLAGAPGIYTRVSKYIDWIQANLEP